ncbi:MAG TPA: hypothetical protein VG796_21600 [Verrucomicrobiales bacterium]|nr:hypothetical protein [Verrucomicrobiales bacterium]
MKTVINLDDNIGLWVGRREPFGTIEDQYKKLLRLARSVAPGTHLPKGVYRFRSFEEADAWEKYHLMKRAAKLSPANPISTTSPGSPES